MQELQEVVDEDDGARSIRTIVPHELERVDEEDKDQIAGQEQQQEQESGGSGRRKNDSHGWMRERRMRRAGE